MARLQAEASSMEADSHGLTVLPFFSGGGSSSSGSGGVRVFLLPPHAVTTLSFVQTALE